MEPMGPMVLTLDGNSDAPHVRTARVWSEIRNLICWRQLFRSRAVANLAIFFRKFQFSFAHGVAYSELLLLDEPYAEDQKVAIYPIYGEVSDY